MSRARNVSPHAAAARDPQGGGCFSPFLLPPLAVILIGTALAAFAFNMPPPIIIAPAAEHVAILILPTAGSIEPLVGASPANEPAIVPESLPPQDQSAVIPQTAAAVPIAPPPLARLFTPEVQFWRESILRWAAGSDLDPNLVAVIMQIESCGDPGALSRSGAIGLFQVMPYHFLPADDPYSPDTNASRGLAYLKRSLAASNNDVRLALAGYNGGIGVISRLEWTWPAETVRYAYWGGGIYADAAVGAEQSARLGEWLTAGGSGLCSRARQRLHL